MSGSNQVLLFGFMKKDLLICTVTN